MRIRRITERNPEGPKRAIISLRRVLDEMKNTKKPITREFYIASRNLPYDYELAEKEFYSKQNRYAPHIIPNKGPLAFHGSKSSHVEFDILSNKSEKIVQDETQ